MIRAGCACTGEAPYDRFGRHWVSDLAAEVVHSLDFSRNETLEDAFQRVVLGK